MISLEITKLLFIFKDGGRNWTSLANYLMHETGLWNVPVGV